jgi:hypothetical protein
MEHSSMNPRIQKLIDQATRTAMWIGDPDAGELDAEKFAELIVRECAKWIVDNAASMEHLGPTFFAKAMKTEFGVEE